MKEIYKIMKNYADKNMYACGNCGADFYFEGRRGSKKCPVCGYGGSKDSDNLDDFQECNLVDFFDYVVESVQHFDNKYTKFTMYGKTVTIDFKSSTMTCEDEFGNVESCEVDVWVLIALCDVYTFRENAKRKREDEMKCPHCGKEIDELPWEIGDCNDYGFEDVAWQEFSCTCPHCEEEFRWVQEYEFAREFVE